MQNLNTFKNEVRAVLTRAGEMYGLERQMANVVIRLDIKGHRVAGMAMRRGFQFTVRFHPDAIAKHYDEMVKDTIPHEVAHTVCQMRPELGANHDRGWKRVCRSLGGDDSRTHEMEFGNRPAKMAFNYITETGHVIDLGRIRHAKLQNGSVRSYSVRGKGRILREGYVSGQAVAEVVTPKTAPPTQVPTTRPPARNGSKASQAREYIMAMLITHSKEQMLLETAMHTEYLFKTCDFGTRGAARSCFVANLNKLA